MKIDNSVARPDDRTRDVKRSLSAVHAGYLPQRAA